MGATINTPANLVVGAGNAYKDGADIGVTADANVFRIEEKRYEPDNLNGLPGMLVGTMYVTDSDGVLDIGAPELTADRLADQWPGSRATIDGAQTTIDRDGNERRVPLSAYADWKLRVKGLTRIYGFELDNAINVGNPEFSMDNGKIALPRMELHSRWSAPAAPGSGEDPEDVDYPSPHRITYTSLVGSGSGA
jgi:hypothetical protein